MISKAVYESAIERAKQLMSQTELPKQRKPTGMSDYDFPNDPAKITIQQIGSLMLKLSSWRGYGNRILGEQEAQLGALNSVFDVIIGREMAMISQERGSRVLKEQLYSLALDGNPVLVELHQKRLEKSTFISTLRAQCNVYGDQWAALSRELTRRGAEQNELH